MKKHIALVGGLVICLIVSACGGGGGGVTINAGGGTGNGATLTVTNAAAASSTMLQAVNLVVPSRAIGEIQVMNVSQPSKPPLQNIVDKMVSVSQKYSFMQKQLEGLHESGTASETATCTNGGSVSVSASWIGLNNPTSPSQVSNLNGSVNFNSCKEGAVTYDGSGYVSIEGSLNAPSMIVVSSPNLRYVDTLNNDNLALGNVTITLTNLVYVGNDLASATAAITGGVSGVLEGNSVSLECDSLRITFNSSSSGQIGSVSGNLKASCLGGWVNLTTTKPLFFSGIICPTDGDMTATSGGNSVRVTVGPSTKINVFFNGNLIQTYKSCYDIAGFCIG